MKITEKSIKKVLKEEAYPGEDAALNILFAEFDKEPPITDSEIDSYLNEGKILTEASNLTPVEKMKLFDIGQRRENVRACGDQKLIDYWNICKSYKFYNAGKQIEAELIQRKLISKVYFSKQNFGVYWAFLEENLMDPASFKNSYLLIAPGSDPYGKILAELLYHLHYNYSGRALCAAIGLILRALENNDTNTCKEVKNFILENFSVTWDEIKDFINDTVLKSKVVQDYFNN